MTVRIHDGFRFASSDLLAVHGMLMGVRPMIADWMRQDAARFMAKRAARWIDDRVLGGEGKRKPLASAYEELRERQRQIRATDARDPEVDHEFLVRVLPFEGRIYGCLVSEKGPAKELFRKHVDVEEFAYWNGVDRPDGISRAEWEERESVWRRLLSQDPARMMEGCGFTVSYVPPLVWSKPEHVLGFVPSRDDRIAQAARRRVRNDLYRARTDAIGAEAAIASACEIMFEIDDLMDSDPEARKLVADEVRRLSDILPEITVDLLLGRGSAAPSEDE